MYKISFDLWKESNSNHVQKYLLGLNPKTSDEILIKLEDYQEYTYSVLLKDKKIKKLGKDLWEVRIRIKESKFRFLGTIKGTTFYLVSGFKKGTQKTPQKELDKARKRILMIN